MVRRMIIGRCFYLYSRYKGKLKDSPSQASLIKGCLKRIVKIAREEHAQEALGISTKRRLGDLEYEVNTGKKRAGRKRTAIAVD